MSRIIALVYNWWNLYVRLALPGQHQEAITSRPLLLTSVGRLTKHSAKKKITITSMHGKTRKLVSAYKRLASIFNEVDSSELKVIAPQLNSTECWRWILAKIIESFGITKGEERPLDVCLLV